MRENLDAILEIVSRAPAQSGFHVLPQHWGVERTFACFGRYRRLSKDDKKLTKSSEATSYLASIHTLLKCTSTPGIIFKTLRQTAQMNTRVQRPSGVAEPGGCVANVSCRSRTGQDIICIRDRNGVATTQTL